MSDQLDKRIREALSDEDAKIFDPDAEMSLFEAIGVSFKSKQRGWVFLTWVMILLVAAGWVFCAVRFFMTDDTNARLAWGFVGLMFMLATQMLKMWNFLEMNKLNVLREIKRLEVRVAALAGAEPKDRE